MQETEISIRVGANIKKYRLKKGLSQEMLSEMISANDKFIGHLERAERKPSLKKLIQIANILEIDISKLFE